MIISHYHKFVFIKTKKTAGSSIELALSPHLRIGDLGTPLGQLAPRHRRFSRPFVSLLREKDATIEARYGHLPYDMIDTHFKQETAGYYSFCVERNPWDKAVSAFYFLLKRGRFNAHEADLENFRDFVASPRLNSFSDFDLYMDKDEQQVDRILKYEDLSSGFGQVMNHLSLSQVTLDGINANGKFRPQSARTLEPFYGPDFDNAAAKAVREAFAREIAYFGYQPTPLATD